MILLIKSLEPYIHKELSLYTKLYIERQHATCFPNVPWRFILHLYFSNQIHCDLKNINKEKERKVK